MYLWLGIKFSELLLKWKNKNAKLLSMYAEYLNVG